MQHIKATTENYQKHVHYITIGTLYCVAVILPE